ncbi:MULTISPECIES: YbaK/EbsC family protein [Fusobacterium]|uniref:YbaK/EbsC family protein n=1 Tax=Fusobacterium TaxID=848 RepID=UPI0014778385|nr:MULTISPECIES: YbaK/EbsC family protein [Fusobacterium]NME35200.1 YbaK/EbsC family protein [Fusobacterium sp. FSA-380-WT-3A]
MSLESVKKYFLDNDLPLMVSETDKDTGTVKDAAIAFGIEEDEIAKTMGFLLKSGECILILMKGTARVDNSKFKARFKEKAVMIPFDRVEELTGHMPGGVCPFGLKKDLRIFLDETLKEFDIVYPAGGTPHSAVKITVDMLVDVTKGEWVNITK